jgi:hypothetical protein
VQTRLTVTFPAGFVLHEGHRVAAGLAGPYDVQAMDIRPAAEFGDSPARARIRRVADHVGANYRAVGGTVERAEDVRSLLVTVTADWAEGSGFGGCKLHTPDVIAATTNAYNAEAEAADLITEDLGGRDPGGAYRPVTGVVTVDGGAGIDSSRAVPPPSDARRMAWTCRPDAPSTTLSPPTGCDAVVAVDRGDAQTLRSLLLLVLGTLLAFAVQVAYDARPRRAEPA